jgi:hypothetical protein
MCPLIPEDEEAKGGEVSKTGEVERALLFFDLKHGEGRWGM